MKSKESVEYSYKCKGDSAPISLNVMSTWSYLSGRKSIFGIALRAPKGNHSVFCIGKPNIVWVARGPLGLSLR